MCRESTAKAFVSACNLNRLILDVVLRLSDTFLGLKVLLGHAAVVETSLRRSEIFKSAVGLRAE